MPDIGLLIKPSSSLCNLRCKYCFYHSLAENREIESYGLMKEAVLEEIVKKALSFADRNLALAFQGGEPTLIGLNFYKKLIEYVDKYNTKGITVNYSIQTNGIVINDEWAEFFGKHKFLVGLSLDGPKEINDLMRVDQKGEGTFNTILKSAALFDKHHVDYNILTVVDASVARHGAKVYNFFKKCGFKYLQFIPCLDPLGEEPGKYPHSLTPQLYLKFLKSVFDLWYNDFMSDDPISIRYFDNLAGIVLGYPPEQCGMQGFCSGQFVVESDGSVYPCDFYVTDEYKTGNLVTDSFEDIIKSQAREDFCKVSYYIDPKCKECDYYRLCRGGCRRNREPVTEDALSLNYYCETYKKFFEYALPKLFDIAGKVKARQQREMQN